MAEKQNESVSGESLTATTKTKFGEFPYPLTDGPEESRYLTWLRNHSNYMAVRGFLDYLRLVGVLMRGIIVNFLIFLPYLLIVAIVLAYFHHWMLGHPYWLTMGLMALGLIWILLFPIMTPLFKIFSYSRSLETGSESSVKQRDLYERSFGAAVLVIVAVALLETLPWALEFLHDLIHKRQYGWTGMLATLAGILALLSGSDKLLSVLSGAKKKLAMALIGVLGLLVPLLVILLATDFLVYGVPLRPSIMFSPLLVPFVGVLGIIIAIPLGLSRQAFSRKEYASVVGLLLAGLVVVAVVIVGGSWATQKNFASTEKSLERIIGPLNRVAAEFTEIDNKEEMDQKVIDLVDQVVIVNRKYGRAMQDLKAKKKATPFLDRVRKKIETLKTSQNNSTEPGSPKGNVAIAKDDNAGSSDEKGLISFWKEIEKQAKWQGEQFDSGQQFITLGNELSALPPDSLEPLRDEIASLAHDKLLEELVEIQPPDGKAESKLDKELARKFIEVAVDRKVIRAGKPDATVFDEKWGDLTDPKFEVYRTLDLYSDAEDSRADKDVFKDELGVEHTRANTREEWNYERAMFRFRQRLAALNVKVLDVSSNAHSFASQLLEERTVEELAKLANEDKLLDRLRGDSTDEQKRKNERESKKELAKLTGKEELAALLSEKDVINLLLHELPESEFEEFWQFWQLSIDDLDKLSLLEERELETPEKESRLSSELLIQYRDFGQDLINRINKELSGDNKIDKVNKQALSKLSLDILYELLYNDPPPTNEKIAEFLSEANVNTESANRNKVKKIAAVKQVLKFEGLAREKLIKRALPGQGKPGKAEKTDPDETKLVARELAVLASSSWDDKKKKLGLMLRRIETNYSEMEKRRSMEADINSKLKQNKKQNPPTKEQEKLKQVQEKLKQVQEKLKQVQEKLEQEYNEKMRQQPIELYVDSLAREELANLVLEEFSTKFLGMLAVLPNLFDIDTDLKKIKDTFKSLDYQFDDRVRAEFERKKAEAEFAKEASLETLVKRAFKYSVAKDAETDLFSKKELGSDRSFPGVAQLLLAQLLLRERKLYKGENLAPAQLARLARKKLVEQALDSDDFGPSGDDKSKDARETLEKVYRYEKEKDRKGQGSGVEAFDRSELASIAVAKFADPYSGAPDKLVSTLMFGKYGPLEQGTLGSAKADLSQAVMLPKAIFVFLLAAVIWLACWLTVDVNLTSIHGLYRDRLASAFLVGQDTQGDVDIEEDVDLEDICRYEARSTAPYHLVNVALNLQGSKDIGIRDRNSDFFIFSKRFIGGDRTGYCRSETLEQVFPQMSLATAMAISAAAASPNMGRGTSPPLVAFMTLLNIRLGYWMPNPGLLEEKQDKANWKQRKKDAKRAKQKEPSQERDEAAKRANRPLGFTFKEVFRAELEEIIDRWRQVYGNASERQERQLAETREPTARHGLVGIGFSGGGIRSATINLGIAQALHKRGVFGHLDYMSTVSGGGYLGSSISTLMRSKTKLATEIEGTVSVDESETEKVVKVTGGRGRTESKIYPFSNFAELDVEENENVSEGKWLIKRRGATSQSRFAGTVKVQKSKADDQIVWVSSHSDERVYLFSKSDQLKVKTGDSVEKKQELNKKPTIGDGENDGDDDVGTKRGVTTSDIRGKVEVGTADAEEQFVSIASRSGDVVHVHRFSRFERVAVKTGDAVTVNQALIQCPNTFGERFHWRIRPSAFLREMASKLDETHHWVNLSDGGHLENLATIELLRRRCKYIIIGDGEADPNLHFTGLATLMRSAYIDLGIDIDIDLEELRLREQNAEKVSGNHWAIGRITYPKEEDNGDEYGYLLYLKSSVTGDEGEVIREYRHRKPTFPHQTTADQMFDEGQFEAYRALGQHIAEQALKAPGGEIPPGKMSFSELETWFSSLWESKNKAQRPAAAKGPATAKRATARKRPAAEKGPTTAKRATARKSRASAPGRTQKKTDT